MTQRVHPYRIHLYRDRAGKWRYRILAGNHRTDAASEQGYRWKRHCTRKAIAAVRPEVLEVNGGPGYTIETITD